MNTIAEAMESIRAGNIIIVVDDEDRENEGDFICASEKVTPEIINFMSKHGRGLICVSLLADRCEELGLELMIEKNTALHKTPFTIPVDLIGSGVTTGISASDRCKTIQALVNTATKKEDLAKPGHIFPLKAQKEGVLKRTGHTEASMDFARISGLYPSGVLVEIMSEDGTMARVPELLDIAKKYNICIVSIKNLIEYRLKTESCIQRGVTIKLPTEYGMFDLVIYTQTTTQEKHFALVKGTFSHDEPVLVRVHSSCMTGDIFGSMRCDCGLQLKNAMKLVEKEKKGLILYMNQEGRGIGIENKLKAYKLQEEGMDTVDANIHMGFKPDERDYGIGAQIIKNLNISKVRLITNNPKKRAGMRGYGIEIVENVPLEIPANIHNIQYLTTKRDKLGHEILQKESK
ncbi:MAG: bifunctional 3,4-dihydroxy-2-butanone-4-phosphate synthase/GTP cyclohydrolase II [Chitinophagaceae bacterium]|nr:bifunctional 3,4-dihydroxy-2-butanone-4-phosphate synthase/GTP cyclohydrolase II [Chitinophagaceae bacterium]